MQISIKYQGPGFEHTTSGAWVSSRDHYTMRHSQSKASHWNFDPVGNFSIYKWFDFEDIFS